MPPTYRKRATAAAIGAATYYKGARLARSMARDTYGAVKYAASFGAAAPIKGLGAQKGRKKRPKKKSNRLLAKDVSQIKSAIKDLRQESDASLGVMTYRTANTSRILVGQNAQAVANFDVNNITDMEYGLGFCKYFDPSNPGTLITANAAAGTYQSNMLFESLSTSITLRNNYQSDVHVKVYLCKVKDDTDSSPYTAWSLGVPDGGNAGTLTALGNYPTDYDIFNDLWSSKVVLNADLSPGQSAKCSHTVSDIEYSPSTVDSHNLEYQKEYKAASFLVVVSGALSHDSVSDQQGLCAAGVDVLLKRTFKVKYEAGANISYIHLINNYTAMTATALQSHQPVPDNITYSIA